MIESDLENIVVEISRDGKTGWGTGFYITENEIATCYHVLATKESGLFDVYYIKHGSWTDWKKATPVIAKCNTQGDFAVIRCEARIQLLPDLNFERWNGVSREFRSYGYGTDFQKIQSEIRSYSIEGTIAGRTWLNRQCKLQLETTKGTIQYGRSGSPVFSSDQKAIIGILYLAGGEIDIESEMILAIPIEDVVTITNFNSIGDKRGLREAISKTFDTEELDILCRDIQLSLANKGIDLEVSLDMVGGISKGAKVLNLIEYLDRRNYLSYLVDAVHRERPELRW
jgi:hypothetical protein